VPSADSKLVYEVRSIIYSSDGHHHLSLQMESGAHSGRFCNFEGLLAEEISLNYHSTSAEIQLEEKVHSKAANQERGLLQEVPYYGPEIFCASLFRFLGRIPQRGKHRVIHAKSTSRATRRWSAENL
jgi:hypothetical protein